jgi:serine/threonine-protein kinase HipA
VFLHDAEVGAVDGDRGRISFRYLETAAGLPPISLRLPYRADAYADGDARPFFENLLPEAEFRRLLAGALRLSDGNTVGLLGAIGGECAGAVSIWPADNEPSRSPKYESLSAEHIQSFFASDDDAALIDATMRSRLSIAGAQEKLALNREGDDWFLPIAGSPSTHILKRSRRMRPNLIENELFSMRLARVAGLDCASAEIVDFHGTRVFVTERFDRERTDAGITKLHQEDLCQALGVLPSAKYESEGGPGYAACAELVEQHSAAPIRDLPELARWMIFNYLIGNADAHAKNVAVLYSEDGVRLTPWYDLLSTLVYKDLSRNAAMKFGGQYDLRWLDADDWLRFATESRLPVRAIRDIAESTFTLLDEGLAGATDAVIRDYGDNPVYGEIGGDVRRRIAIARDRIGTLEVGKKKSTP